MGRFHLLVAFLVLTPTYAEPVSPAVSAAASLVESAATGKSAMSAEEAGSAHAEDTAVEQGGVSAREAANAQVMQHYYDQLFAEADNMQKTSEALQKHVAEQTTQSAITSGQAADHYREEIENLKTHFQAFLGGVTAFRASLKQEHLKHTATVADIIGQAGAVPNKLKEGDTEGLPAAAFHHSNTHAAEHELEPEGHDSLAVEPEARDSLAGAESAAPHEFESGESGEAGEPGAVSEAAPVKEEVQETQENVKRELDEAARAEDFAVDQSQFQKDESEAQDMVAQQKEEIEKAKAAGSAPSE